MASTNVLSEFSEQFPGVEVAAEMRRYRTVHRVQPEPQNRTASQAGHHQVSGRGALACVVHGQYVPCLACVDYEPVVSAHPEILLAVSVYLSSHGGLDGEIALRRVHSLARWHGLVVERTE